LDNLTHTLTGVLLGRAGLKRLTGRATAALVIASNLPDIDSFVAPLLGLQPIAVHRGFTHGVGGLVTLPFFTAAMVFAWERLRSGKSLIPVRFWPLVLVALIGGLFHSLLDWLTSYGTRLLEPLSHSWFYGDAWFIVDPWIWVMLILGLELSWRAERRGKSWTRPALWAFGAVLGYIALNAAISLRAVAVTRPLVARVAPPRMIVAGEVPIAFWKRKMVWRGDAVGGFGTYNLLDGLNHARLSPRIIPLNLDDPRLAAAAERERRVRAFLFWSRMPMVYRQDGRAFLTDQRFFEEGRASSTNFLIPLDKPRVSS
jgi:inner membrane protein